MPMWQPNYPPSTGVSARCAVQPSVYGSKSAAPLPGCCEKLAAVAEQS
jgi:hypothetical protein